MLISSDSWVMDISMPSNEAKNEMLVMVLADLSPICRKLAENSAVPEGLHVKAREFVTEFDSLLPVRGEGTAPQHAQAESLLIKIARFLPSVLEVDAAPATVPNQ
jgi:hypothetical protein